MFPFFQPDVSATEPDAELWSAVKPLGTTITFLNTGAHPDDERSDLLAYLSRGLGVKTASLIANRGEGGQNEIGSELDNGLGIIRSREMIEAAKITGVKAYHLSETTSDAIYDFGFSKGTEETLEQWGEELTYERLIRFIRTYQPDILMPSFRDVASQHGHHRTISILSEKAFEDAADPSVFPEQLREGLSVWQVKKFYLPANSQDTATTSIEIGDYDPIYQMSYPQLGEESRFMHKSQGMGNDIPVAPRQSHLELIKSAVDTDGENDLFAGIPYDFSEWADELPRKERSLKQQFSKFQDRLNGIIDSYPDNEEVFEKSQKALKEVRALTQKTKRTRLDAQLKNDLLHKLSLKEEQLQEASFKASGLETSVDAGVDILTRGAKTSVKITMKNNGSKTLKDISASLTAPKGWKVQKSNEGKGKEKGKHRGHDGKHNKGLTLKPGQTYTVTYTVQVPKNASYYHAYEEPAIQAAVSYEANGTKTTHPVEFSETIAVLPDLSLTLSPEDIVVNTANVQDEIPVTVKVKNNRNGKTSGQVSLTLPEGWTAAPAKTAINLSKQGEEKEVQFKLKPPAKVEAGSFEVEAVATADGKKFTDTVQEISYDHIGTFYYLYPAVVNGAAFELATDKSLNIGYIDSGFDQVADYLTNAGVEITKLTEADLESGDLSQYDTIVTGIRAYLSRSDLAANNERLKEYVANGGHLVVQYHKPNDGWNAETTAPYPLTIGNPSISWRVTDETADVEVLKPESALFNYPNKIGTGDWDNWVQERGLYFPMAWGPEYETFVKMADPGEDPFEGGILMAEYGEGTYLYTNLVFYRQIQDQVPGAYRIFTNLISYSGSGK